MSALVLLAFLVGSKKQRSRRNPFRTSHRASRDQGLEHLLTAPRVFSTPIPEYARSTRLWQGIPAIERARNGRLLTASLHCGEVWGKWILERRYMRFRESL
jgi:hypothetical protein